LSCEYYGFGGHDLPAFLQAFCVHSKSKVHIEGIVACYESLIDEFGELAKETKSSKHSSSLSRNGSSLWSAQKNHPQVMTML